MGNVSSTNGVNKNSVTDIIENVSTEIITSGKPINTAIRSVCEEIINSKGFDTKFDNINISVNSLTGSISGLTTSLAETNRKVSDINVKLEGLKQTEGSVGFEIIKSEDLTAGKIRLIGKYILTGKSIMSWGNISDLLTSDNVLVKVSVPGSEYIFKEASVQITQKGADGASSFSIGIKEGSEIIGDSGQSFNFTVQSFGAKPYAFSWFIFGTLLKS